MDSYETKTTFANEKSFSWIEGDKIGVFVTLGETSSILQFTAGASGANVTFSHELTDAELTLLGESDPVFGIHAYYPYDGGNAAITVGGTDANPTITLAGTITQPTVNPMSTIPMVGINSGTGSYSFQAITGILKVTVTDVPESATSVTLTANGQAFNGTYSLQERTGELYIDMNHFSQGWIDKWVQFTPTNDGDSYDSPLSTEETRSFYFPIPEGEIASGMVVALRNSSNEVLFSRTTNKTIGIDNNTITPLANFTTWKSLGTGKFIDDRSFNIERGFTSEYVNVEIQQSRIDPSHYRLVNPYGVAWEHYNYTWNASWTPVGPNGYLSFYVMNQGTQYPHGTPKPTAALDGMVYFFPHFTGSYNQTKDKEIRLTHSNFHNNAYLSDSKVYKFQNSGLPANVSLHPRYTYRKDGLGSECFEDTNILIAFPGCSEIAYGAISSISIGGTTAAPSTTISWTGDISYVKMVVSSSTNYDDKIGDEVTLSTSGEVTALSMGEAASGMYYVVVKAYDSSDNVRMTQHSAQFQYLLPPTAAVSGAYNARIATLTHNDAPKIKYGIATSSTATLSSLTTYYTIENSVDLAPSSTGTYYFVYQGYKEDETTPIGGENTIRFLYCSDDVSTIAGKFLINNNSNFGFDIEAITPPDEGKNVKITRYYSSNSEYGGATGTCSGVYNPADGTITIPSGQELTKSTKTYYLVATSVSNFSSNTDVSYKDNYVLTIQAVENNAGLKFNCDYFSVAKSIDTSNKQFQSGGQHWSNGTPYLYKAN